VIRLLAAGVTALALAGSALVGSATAASPPRQADLEAEIVCPTCHTTLDQSSSPIATRMKAYIRARIAAGDTSAQIKAKLVDQFGPAVLAEPPKRGFDLLAWLLPLAGIAAGALALAGGAWAWSRNRAPGDLLTADGPPLDPALARRVDEELARYDG
jgi:cytochrome c-type biogenesis protein CcmH